jgi:hypothetical protein
VIAIRNSPQDADPRAPPRGAGPVGATRAPTSRKYLSGIRVKRFYGVDAHVTLRALRHPNR